jgi:PAS domain-containing protein
LSKRNTSRIKKEYAPAERAEFEEIKADAQLLSTSESLQHLTNAVPCIMMSLNKERQVVFKNRVLMQLLEADRDDLILGKRPGELFECIHSSETLGGCGTTRHCSKCGALEAILDSWATGKTIVNECRIITHNGKAYEFVVRATKYHYSDKDFLIFSLVDISDQKRKDALERTFFHDINNTLGVILGFSQLFERVEDPDKKMEFIKRIRFASEQLVREISSHAKLLQAEKDELGVSICKIESLDLVQDLKSRFQDNELWKDRIILLDSETESITFSSDYSLLSRVLENMVKNALEATTPEAKIRIVIRSNQKSITFKVNNPGTIPEDIQLQLFQRSFSTRGKGRGIGTYSMKLFGEKYLKGKVDFSSSPKNGTTFYISLPLVFPENSNL